MKKLISLLVLLAVTVYMACGCSFTISTDKPTQSTPAATTATEQTTKEAAAATDGTTTAGDTKESTEESTGGEETTTDVSGHQSDTGGLKKNAKDVHFERKFDGAGNESAVIEGLSADGKVLWTVTTGTYPVSQLDSVVGLGINDGKYYYVEKGTVKAISLADGSEVWKNGEFEGSPSPNTFAFGEDGTLYVGGYFGPDLFAVDKNGKTLKRVETLDSNFYWPSEFKIKDGKLAITFEMPGDVLYVDLSDYSLVGGGSSVPAASNFFIDYVTCSGFLSEPAYGVDHLPQNVLDGKLSTGWCENASGQGIGEWLKFTLTGEYRISGFEIYNGFQASDDHYKKNSRPKSLIVTFSDGSTVTVDLKDQQGKQTVTFDTPKVSSSIMFTINDVYEGYKYKDTVISEISLY